MAAARKMLDRVMIRGLLLTRGGGGSMLFRRPYLSGGGNLYHQSWKLGGGNHHHHHHHHEFDLSSYPEPICIDASTKLNIDLDDFLGAKKFGNKFLMRSCRFDQDKFEQVPVESLRGKIVGLYFQEEDPLLYSGRPPRVTCAFREFYNTLKLTKPNSFEMIYVPPKHHDPSVHNGMISTLPWLSIPVDDIHWISYLHQLYLCNHYITFFDVRNDKVQVLPSANALYNIYYYGPHYYPFTEERVRQLELETQQLGKETSIQAILGSASRDYLIDRHSNQVPISSLQSKNVLLFAYSTSHPTFSESLCFEQLVKIYNKLRNHGCEIVSISFDCNGGNEKKQKLWNDHFVQIPWLSLPFGDDKIWLLRKMAGNVLEDCSDPILFVKPKGESVLDPYGYQVLQTFGIRAFPYSRMGAAKYLVKRLKGISFKSYVDEASELDLDFNSLIRNTAEGGIEHVSLSTILEGRVRGILLLFACLGTCSQERLQSLISVYNTQCESSSPFEVIFVSTDKDIPSFYDHFSMMPWFAFQRPIKRREHSSLARRTTKINFNGHSNFLAFGADQLVQQAGLITKSFENCEFPFINDAESIEHIAFRITKSLELEREADGTPCYEGDGWWNGIEHESDPDAHMFSEMEDCFYNSSFKSRR